MPPKIQIMSSQHQCCTVCCTRGQHEHDTFVGKRTTLVGMGVCDRGVTRTFFVSTMSSAAWPAHYCTACPYSLARQKYIPTTPSTRPQENLHLKSASSARQIPNKTKNTVRTLEHVTWWVMRCTRGLNGYVLLLLVLEPRGIYMYCACGGATARVPRRARSEIQYVDIYATDRGVDSLLSLWLV